MHTWTIKVTFAINSILKLSHKKLSSTKLEKNRNSQVIVKFMKQFCYTQRLIAWLVKKKIWAACKAWVRIFLQWGNHKPHQTPNESHMQNICAWDVRLFAWLMVIILKVFPHHFNSFFFFFWLSAFFCYLQELLILLTAEQKSKSESKQLVMSFQWPISMKLRAKTSRLRQCQPSEFISEGELCWGKEQRRDWGSWALQEGP